MKQRLRAGTLGANLRNRLPAGQVLVCSVRPYRGIASWYQAKSKIIASNRYLQLPAAAWPPQRRHYHPRPCPRQFGPSASGPHFSHRAKIRSSCRHRHRLSHPQCPRWPGASTVVAAPVLPGSRRPACGATTARGKRLGSSAVAQHAACNFSELLALFKNPFACIHVHELQCSRPADLDPSGQCGVLSKWACGSPQVSFGIVFAHKLERTGGFSET